MKNLFSYEFRFCIVCITGLILIIQISESQAQNIVFSEDSVISTGYKPFALASEDFNADDMPDVAFANINELISDPVQIHLNDGFGKLNVLPDSLYINTDDPKDITAGDLNNDQIADLAVAIYEDSAIVLLFGNGDGTFSRGSDLKISTKPSKVVIADFDKDQNNDLAIASHFGILLIYKGDGSGSFEAEPFKRTGVGSVQDLEQADLNKDGYTDLLIGTGNVHAVEIFLNDGTGSFPTHNNLATYRTSWHIKTADFNNDGYQDIISGSGSYDFDNVFVLLGDEAGEYTCVDTLSPCSYVDDVVVGDFNHDFRVDAIIGDRHGIYLLTGAGDGHFSSIDTIDYLEHDYQTNALEVVDMDGDGRMDIVVARDQQISVYYNTTIITSIDKQKTNPVDFKLNQNYPNPFNPVTMINYQLPVTSDVNLSIYNLLGQKVATLVNRKQRAGTYSVQWDASRFSSGIYFYSLKTNNSCQFRKMQLIK